MALDAKTRKSILTGAAATLVGLLLLYVGVYVLGELGTTGGDVGAGFVTLLGMTTVLLAFLMYLLPPLLPAK